MKHDWQWCANHPTDAAETIEELRQTNTELLAALETILRVEEGFGETDRPHMIKARAAVANAKPPVAS